MAGPLRHIGLTQGMEHSSAQNRAFNRHNFKYPAHQQGRHTQLLVVMQSGCGVQGQYRGCMLHNASS